jgi:hypothetical protein
MSKRKTRKNKKNIKYTAIIVEPRKHKALFFVLNNILENLSSEWNVIIMHGNLNKEYIKDIIENKLYKYKKRIELLSINKDNLSINEYNELLTSKQFYNNIPTELCLVFQTDSMINPLNNTKINNFLKYDYVGAPWIDTKKCGNGGFSLRRKSKMLEIIDNCPYTNIPEDVYFSNSYSNVSVNKPDFELSKEFSSEQILNPASFGIHQPWCMNKNIEELEKIFPGVQELYNLNN